MSSHRATARTTAQPAKFTFDLDLGRRSERDRSMSESALAGLVEAARAEAYAEGLRDGEKTASAQAAQAIATAAGLLASRTAELTAAFDRADRARLAEAVTLAADVGRKLAAGLIAAEPTAEIETLLAECMATLEAVPHLVVRCHPDLAAGVREIAEAQMAMSGFGGRLVVMADPEHALGDARIEWVDGGLVRDGAAISHRIDEEIDTFLRASGAQRKGAKR